MQTICLICYYLGGIIFMGRIYSLFWNSLDISRKNDNREDTGTLDECYERSFFIALSMYIPFVCIRNICIYVHIRDICPISPNEYIAQNNETLLLTYLIWSKQVNLWICHIYYLLSLKVDVVDSRKLFRYKLCPCFNSTYNQVGEIRLNFLKV